LFRFLSTAQNPRRHPKSESSWTATLPTWTTQTDPNSSDTSTTSSNVERQLVYRLSDRNVGQNQKWRNGPDTSFSVFSFFGSLYPWLWFGQNLKCSTKNISNFISTFRRQFFASRPCRPRPIRSFTEWLSGPSEMLLRDWSKSIGKFPSETKNSYFDSFYLIQVINYLVGAKYVFNLKKSFRDVSKTKLSRQNENSQRPRNWFTLSDPVNSLPICTWHYYTFTQLLCLFNLSRPQLKDHLTYTTFKLFLLCKCGILVPAYCELMHFCYFYIPPIIMSPMPSSPLPPLPHRPKCI